MASKPPSKPRSERILIRPLYVEDAPFLEEMLYQAIWTPPDEPRPLRSVISDPVLRRYIDGWASHEGDFGFLAYDPTTERSIGAVWLRNLKAPGGYGYWDDQTPELSMAVVAEARSHGLGTRLLEVVTAAASTRVSAISLSVAAENPAVRLYQRFGFVAVKKQGASLVMVLSLDRPAFNGGVIRTELAAVRMSEYPRDASR
jgi:GNAT superfamily N-acetyltransferase